MIIRNCQERPGVDPLCLARSALSPARGGVLPQWPEFPSGQTVPAYRARTALVTVCRRWGIGPGDQVLVPAYNCGCELDTLRHLGVEVCFYRIDERGGIDLGDLYARVTGRTRIVYVIHYFGWPQDLRELTIGCRRRGIRVVEDCALALFSRDGATPVGSAGDAAIFSFPKTLPVPDGGAVVLSSHESEIALPRHRPPLLRVGRKAASLAKVWLMGRTPARAMPGPLGEVQDHEQYLASHPEMPAHYYHEAATSEWAMSRVTAALLWQADPRQIIERRRRNYLLLDRRFRPIDSLEPLFNLLPAGVCPLVYPLVVRDRPWWVAALRARGIGAIPWWEGHHGGFDWDPFPEAHNLKMQILALPVHQDLNEEQVDWIASSVICLAQSAAVSIRS